MDGNVGTPALDPVPDVPAEQEQQTRNQWQVGQTTSPDNPPTRGVSQRRALEGQLAPEGQAAEFTLASTIDELIKSAFFVAASIDEPIVDAIDRHRLNLHYPADGSLVTIRIEARAGAWGGIGPLSLSPEEDTDRNARYDEAKAAAEAPPPVVEEEAQGPENTNPAYTVQRQ